MSENEVLEFEDLVHLLLDLHVVLVAVVSDHLELLGYGDGLRHGSVGLKELEGGSKN